MVRPDLAAPGARGGATGARSQVTLPDGDGLEGSLSRARQALQARQHADGWWQGEDEANQTLDAQYIFLLHFTGLLARPEYQDKARRLANRIRRTQRADGTWAIYFDAPGCVSVTTES